MNNLFARLTCAALATALLATVTAGSASADSETPDTSTIYSTTQGGQTAQVQEVNGQIVSSVVDEKTGDPIQFDESDRTPQLVDGKPNGAAVMGQWLKGDDYPEQVAAAAAVGEASLAGEPVAAAASSLLSAAAFTPNWGTLGVDVSGHQGSAFNWTLAKNGGARFGYMKATEGTYYPNSRFPKSIFDTQWRAATSAGLIRGAYHFANPSWSSGASQADHFINNGGGWSADARTLPGLLDMEQSPYTEDHCYDLTPRQMVNWIRDFSNRYKARTGRLPAIYTGAYWWNDCTNNSTAFNDHPMMIAAYKITTPKPLPSGWSNYDIWQYSETAIAGVDSNVFNGSYTALQNLAKNPAYKPIGGKAPYVPTPAPALKFTVNSSIKAQYDKLGGSAVFGTPTMNAGTGLSHGGIYQNFSKNHTFYRAPHSGAWPVNYNGAIGKKFAAGRYERGYGYPVSTSKGGLVNGGYYQKFRTASGAVTWIYWSPATGAHVVKNGGDIVAKWKAAGYERGYGYPMNDKHSGLVNGGYSQSFRKGTIVNNIMWSPATGARVVVETSPVGKEWKAAGAERGYGYPVDEERTVGAERQQKFSKGFVVHYSTKTKQTWITRD